MCHLYSNYTRLLFDATILELEQLSLLEPINLSESRGEARNFFKGEGVENFLYETNDKIFD